MTEEPAPPSLGDEIEPADDPYDELVDAIRALRDHVAYLDNRLRELEEPDAVTKRREPAPWVVYSPPAAAGDPRHEDQDPGFTLENFVAWYNLTYTGLPGTRARPIPDCWPQHPGLASEIATLAYSWREAFIGRTAHAHKAQLWHQHSRPGFADRLTTEWVHPHCHDGRHRPTGAPARSDRYGMTDRHLDHDVT